MTAPICIHFDPIVRKTRCELATSRVAVRDCPCNAYENDTGYGDRTIESDKVRDELWAQLMTQKRATGV